VSTEEPPVAPTPLAGAESWPYAAIRTGTRPRSHLAWAVLATLFCCLPTGILAVVYAAKVDGLFNAGDYVSAREASRHARDWVLISVGAIVALVAVLVFAVGPA